MEHVKNRVGHICRSLGRARMNAREGQVAPMPGHMWDIDMAHMKTRVGKMTEHMKDKGRAQMKACIKIWGKDVEHVKKRVGHMPWLRQGRDRYEGKSRASGGNGRALVEGRQGTYEGKCSNARTHVGQGPETCRTRAGHM